MRLVLAGLAMLAMMPRAARAQAPAPRPNIVYILSDDQGWADVGYRGSDARTPNIDALAKGGVRLDQFYAQPMCTPSRAALMTGRYPHRYGLQTIVIPSAGTYGLPTDERTLPQVLKQAGYATAIVGKWHLGHADRKYWPLQRGFDRQYGPLLGEIDYFSHSAHGTRDWFRDEKPLDERGYATTLIGDEAVRYVEGRDRDTPFFLYLTFTAPHSPYQAPPEALAAFASVEDPARRAYLAMLSVMDAQVGRVVAALERKGLRERTLIVFQSDNGGPASARFTGEVDMSKSTIPPSNKPYRDGKGTLYEGGTRVVALANWPGRIAAGRVVDEPMHIVDMLPTLAGLAGASTAGTKPLDGLDVWGTIAAGKPSPRTEVVYDIEPFRGAVRRGPWKLVWQSTLPSRTELYDIARDPYETTDLADRQPQVVAELKRRIEELAKDGAPPLILGDAMPALKAQLFGHVALPADLQAVHDAP
jgi:arylsulfatase A-like enzyme